MNIPPIQMGPTSLGLVNEDGTISVKKRPFCYPEKFVIDEKERTVSCEKCGRAVDPIEALIILARDGTRWLSEQRHFIQQRQIAEADLEKVRRDLKSAKAARRRTEKP